MVKFNKNIFPMLDESEFLKKISEINRSLDENTLSSGYRNLAIEEINQLKKQNNHAENWESVYVAEGFLTSFILNSRFYGKCYLGRFTGFPLEVENDTIMQSGIYDSIIKDSKIDDEALICRCGLISNYIVSSYTVLYNNSTITSGKNNFFANGRETVIGPETGERAVKIFAEMNMQIAESILSHEDISAYDEFISEYKNRCSSKSGYIGKNCRIINTVSIKNSYISDTATVSGNP